MVRANRTRLLASGMLFGVALTAAAAAHAQTQTQRGVAVAATFFDGAGVPAAVAIQPDGRVIAVGSVRRPDGTDRDFAVMRYLPDGTPDPAFGRSGRVTTDFGRREDAARAVALQPDGAIVVAGNTSNPAPGPVSIAALARYSPEGVLDVTFGSGGTMVDPDPEATLGDAPHDVRAVAVAPAGDILLSVDVNLKLLPGLGYELQRYSGNGVPLPSWGGIDRFLHSLHPFAFASNGRLVTLGVTNALMAPYLRGRLDRYTADGAPDTTFNGTGTMETAETFNGLAFYGNAVAVHADDRIVVARNASLVRFTAAGAPDLTYGYGGAVTGGYGPGQYGNYRAITVGADDTIVAAGNGGDPGNPGGGDFIVLATTRSGGILLNAPVDFGGEDYADAVRIVGADVIAAGWSVGPVRTDVAWTRLVLNPWRPLIGAAVKSDWDGDGKADMVVTASTGEWRIALSRTGFSSIQSYQWGGPLDVPVVTDLAGEGRMELTVYNGTVWSVLDPLQFQTAYRVGAITDIPVPGDYFGDRRNDVAVFRPDGTWLVYDPITGYSSQHQWGQRSDVPIPRDYTGDGRTDLAIYRPSTGVWAVLDLATGVTSSYQWGLPGDVPVPADYLGTGRVQIAIYRPSAGRWWIFNPSTGQYFGVNWGAAGDIPVPGDYVGDRRVDLAVWRPATGAWFVWDLAARTFTPVGLGAPQPLP